MFGKSFQRIFPALGVALAITILALPASAQTYTYTPLYSFGAEGQENGPTGPLALGQDGNFYGTAYSGQSSSYAEIYKITPTGEETILWTAPPYDEGYSGSVCNTGLTLGADGLFYGTCNFWGGNNYVTGGSGIVFQYDPSQGQNGFTVLYSFPSCWSGDYNDSFYPGPLTLGTDGNLYGTTYGSSSCANPNGTVFRITPTGTFTILHAFAGYTGDDGSGPTGALALGTDGNFYGTTYEGGNTGQNGGTVFKMSSAGKVTLLYSFANTYGPSAGVTEGADGKYYGTTYENGTYGEGTIFQITTGGKIAYLHNFNYATDDAEYPTLALTLGTDGNFYGPAIDCFPSYCNTESLFKITTKGVYTDLFNDFVLSGPYCPDNSTTGCWLSSPMFLHPNGIFYGTTLQGGMYKSEPVGRGVFYSFDTGFAPYIILQYPRGMISTTLGIFGTGFTDATAVSFHGVAATFKVVSDTYLTATIPTGATTGNVTVTEPSRTLTSAMKFTVLADKNPKPSITSLSPSSVTAGSAAFTLTVFGTNFIDTSVVNWAGSPLVTTYVSGTELTVPVSAADVAKAGTVEVTVTNPTPGGGTSASHKFTID